jgi:hypothetical protein
MDIIFSFMAIMYIPNFPEVENSMMGYHIPRFGLIDEPEKHEKVIKA